MSIKNHIMRERRMIRKFDFLSDNLARAFIGEITGTDTGINEYGRETAHRILMNCKRKIKLKFSALPDMLLTEENVTKYEKVLDEADEILNKAYRQIFLGPGRMRSKKCSECIYSKLNLPEDFE